VHQHVGGPRRQGARVGQSTYANARARVLRRETAAPVERRSPERIALCGSRPRGGAGRRAARLFVFSLFVCLRSVVDRTASPPPALPLSPTRCYRVVTALLLWQVWALSAAADESFVVTGGGDSMVRRNAIQ
jgi:hypothetical protein